MCCILLTFVHMYICFRGTHGRLAYMAKCAVLFKYCINKNKKKRHNGYGLREITVYNQVLQPSLPYIMQTLDS